MAQPKYSNTRRPRARADSRSTPPRLPLCNPIPCESNHSRTTPLPSPAAPDPERFPGPHLCPSQFHDCTQARAIFEQLAPRLPLRPSPAPSFSVGCIVFSAIHIRGPVSTGVPSLPRSCRFRSLVAAAGPTRVIAMSATGPAWWLQPGPSGQRSLEKAPHVVSCRPGYFDTQGQGSRYFRRK